jgi:hypothetical protein
MSNNYAHARSAALWCMSMLTLGTWGVVSGAPTTIANGELLAALCVVPPLFMLLVWRRAASPVALAAVAAGLALVMTATPASAQSQARYRNFQLGADLPAIAALAGVQPATATTVHARPVLMQELQWRRSYSAEPDAVQQIVFSFYDNQLSTMVVDYDRDRTAGMTDADLVEALTAMYGAPLKRGVRAIPGLPSSLEQESGTLVARWGAADYAVALYRSSYAEGFRVIVGSPRLEALARTAVLQANRLDARDAPGLEIARQKKEAEDLRASQAKARLANKATFKG